MNHVIDRYANIITLLVTVPPLQGGMDESAAAAEEGNRHLQRSLCVLMLDWLLLCVCLTVVTITVTLQIDRRKTLEDLKLMLEEIVLVPSTEFKVQCIECGTIII